MSIYFKSLNDNKPVERCTLDRHILSFYPDGVYITSEYGDQVFLNIHEVKEVLNLFKDYLGEEK